MRLEMKDIVMEFGPVRAVDRVSITVEQGEIVGLLGENGAGKSTLMNILAGVYTPVSGKILIDGQEVVMKNVQTAEKNGIRFIHQELNLCKDLRVWENMFLGEEIKSNPLFVNKKEMIKRCKKIFDRMNTNIDPEAIVDTLSAADKQMLEIGKALQFESNLIIMDEPSTAISTEEIENLFKIMRQLKKEGVSLIYISHKMPELFEICDTYFIMRDGKLVSSGKFDDVNEEIITEKMIGHNLQSESYDSSACNKQEKIVLSASHIQCDGIKDLSFDLHQGEILAVTGLQGSGRDMLADVLFGVEPFSGELRINDKLMSNRGGQSTIGKYLKNGVAMVPRMRAERGIHNDLSVLDNMSMGFFNTKFHKIFISKKEETERFERERQAMGIKVGSTKNPITSLSGGNQQKVILGKWLETDADILLLDNPTQGIDVGTKFEIYNLILDLASKGKSIIVFSSEFPEIYRVADSCIVLYKGKCNAWLNRDELTEKNMMYYSTGANLESIADEK